MSDDVAVFARGASVKMLPLERIPRETAEELVVTKFARWVNDRHKSIQMTREPATLKLRDTSCQMGPSVIWRYLLGDETAVACVHAYQGIAA